MDHIHRSRPETSFIDKNAVIVRDKETFKCYNEKFDEKFHLTIL